MQLRNYLIVLLGLIAFTLYAQDDKEYKLDAVEADLLFNYYDQSGNHGAVQGGVGDQDLQDRVASIKVKIPLDTSKVLSVSMSVDSYTSASSDKIDHAVSSASYRDVRAYGSANYSWTTPKEHTWSAGAGFSAEYDVTSVSGNFSWDKSFNDNNQALSIGMHGLYDKWMLLYPVELRKDIKDNVRDGLDNDVRKTIGTSITYQTVISRRMQMSFTYDYIFQQGLLSTPFHRVAFDTTGTAQQISSITGLPLFEYDSNNDGIVNDLDLYQNFELNDNGIIVHDIERLPDYRHKHAFGVRNNWYPLSWLIVRSYFRYYFDSFGIESFTASMELPVKFTRFFSVYPFYRYYTQDAADYFAPFQNHNATERYYTSDYDLSEFTSDKYGLGLRISPAFGIYHKEGALLKGRDFSFKSIDLRFAKYHRSDGLDAWMITAGFGFKF